MIKKITLVLILTCIVVSCGKKGDPEYKDSKNNTQLQSVIIFKT